VNDAFTSGGAQVTGGRRRHNLELASDVDYVRGRHAVRIGFNVEADRFDSDESSNYLGTYTFTSREAFLAGQPASYVRRIGNPAIRYWNVEAAAYVQDDIRLRKNLTISPGLRYEAQTHVPQAANIAPRFGVTWAPFKSGRTSLRASWGVFYSWFSSGIYEQTLRVDGFRQREMDIVNPSYPVADEAGIVSATNRYLLGSGRRLPRTKRISAGVDQTVTQKVRVSVTYSDARETGLFRGRNLNARVDGIRPDPAFANVVEAVADARARSRELATSVNINLAGGVRGASRPRWNWRRTTLRFSYWLASEYDDGGGAFTVPASGTVATEWGPASGDRRHRVSASLTSQALRNLSLNLSLSANSGTPYTITTGSDDNGDSIFNDRPAGVGRNTLRTPSHLTLSSNFSYNFRFGPPPPGDEGGSDSGRYRLSVNVNVTNLTNRANYSGFSGVMTSPFFRTATSVANPRRIDIGMGFGF
jgi:hypothetical protein